MTCYIATVKPNFGQFHYSIRVLIELQQRENGIFVYFLFSMRKGEREGEKTRNVSVPHL